MKVVMRIKPALMHKLKRGTMPVGEHIVGREKEVFEITKENVHHLESTGTKHWIEISDVDDLEKVEAEAEVVKTDAEVAEEIAEDYEGELEGEAE